ncbi:MAG: bifunctional UDP-N-acetylglucosamine diphosphorylase/glucosamine-1-phosphate N-acetyltransferase GlmU [Burkholderiales bacterium]|nr:bifunctional UDP-N-acetylglucosamine diphosphorylase/glucosamine-1-phosphate N-acetyltransferase GlmU [Burkholderiales bacterium]
MNVVILAAGMGKRMRSELPKVLHPIAGKPMLGHVLDRARSLAPKRLVVVYGHGGEQVPTRMAAPDIAWARQEPQLGTGHAVMQAAPLLDDSVPTLILYGDVPLTTADTLARLCAAARPAADGSHGEQLAILTNGRITRIVEQKDADAATLTIREINTGILVVPTAPLRRWLGQLSNRNAQGEYYLTDVIASAVADGLPVVSVHPGAEWETLGVNSKVQLAQLERIHQGNLAHALLENGVTLIDPARIDVRGQLTCGRDVAIDVNCVFEGEVSLADGVSIGANCVLRDAVIEAGAQILPFTHIEGARVGPQARIGPYARLRPGTVLGAEVHVGNFVELKNAQLDTQAKANHLAYVGDAVVGKRVNIGAGTITCNYDGANKYQTVIEDDAFIGSDTQLVAPVTVGRGATLGAGTTLTRDAPAGKLTISRARQTTLDKWQRPVKKPKG